MGTELTTQIVVVVVILGLGFIGALLMLGMSQGEFYMTETLLILVEITLLAIYMDIQKLGGKSGGKR
jgi:hypothetical protein